MTTRTEAAPELSAEDEMAERFPLDIARHRMEVVRDDGLYRHLRFRRWADVVDYETGRPTGRQGPSAFYWFEIVTWPGALAIRGDCGDYLFARVDDMFGFFRGSRVNPGYWAEKVRASVSPVKVYSEQKFRRRVREHVVEAIRDGDAPRGIGRAITRDVLASDETCYEDGARRLLADFEYGWVPVFRFARAWEWDLRDWDWQYLWCCHAIVWGIAQYDAARAATAEASRG